MDNVVKSRWVIYTVLAYSISWIIWLPFILNSRDLIELPKAFLSVLGPIGTFGPLFAALILVYREGRLGSFFRTATAIRFPWYFWVVALLLWPAIQGFGFFTAAGLGDVQLTAAMFIPLATLIPVFMQTFLIGGPLGEEFGWRGYALPSLLETNGPIKASIILGFIHAFWHLPVWFVIGEGGRDMPFALFALQVVSQTPIYTWLYLRGNRSIWPVMLFHTTQNMMFFQVFGLANGTAAFAVFFYIVVIGCVVSMMRRDRSGAGSSG